MLLKTSFPISTSVQLILPPLHFCSKSLGAFSLNHISLIVLHCLKNETPYSLAPASFLLSSSIHYSPQLNLGPCHFQNSCLDPYKSFVPRMPFPISPQPYKIVFIKISCCYPHSDFSDHFGSCRFLFFSKINYTKFTMLRY